MRDVFICDAVRTPIGRFGGALAKVRADDLAAAPIKALMARHPKLDWSEVDEVYFGCANQAGEDNRNVARMALLLAGLPESVPGQTLNRLCASGLDAVGAAGRAHGVPGFCITQGARVIDSTPPAIAKSISPARIARAPAPTASRPEAQRRLRVWPGPDSGRPASSNAMRATLRLSSPAWLAQPK